MQKVRNDSLIAGGDCGWTINISSILGLVGMPGSSCYSATKGAVLQMTKACFILFIFPCLFISVSSSHPGHRPRVRQRQDPRQQHPLRLHRDEHARTRLRERRHGRHGDAWPVGGCASVGQAGEARGHRQGGRILGGGWRQLDHWAWIGR